MESEPEDRRRGSALGHKIVLGVLMPAFSQMQPSPVCLLRRLRLDILFCFPFSLVEGFMMS